MKNTFLITIIFTLVLSISSSAPANEKPREYKNSNTIKKIIKNENRTWVSKEIMDIVNCIDNTYNNLYDNLLKSKKIIIFFDPAHGKLSDGRWQGGAATKRLSCTGLPEEYYSIIFSRLMYDKLKKNPHIQVETTDDYMKVLKGESNIYKNIPFSTTVEKASEAGAFMIISEHLNNVSQIYKAGGKINIPGIHITRDYRGRKILKYVSGSHSGFLTLYNKLDASGFSKNYALNLKNDLIKKGHKANNWEFGAVGDDRFSYFIDYPLSIIYESGFISNPHEEKKLKDHDHVKTMIDSQYKTLLQTISEIFGIDISDDEIKKTGEMSKSRIELLKLSRIAIYYLKRKETKNALNAISLMEKFYSRSAYKNDIRYYTNIRKKLVTAESYYRLGRNYTRKKWHRTARKYYKKAINITADVKLLNAYTNKYSAFPGNKKRIVKRRTKTNDPMLNDVKRSPLSKSLILTIEEGQTLESALQNALDPDDKNLSVLIRTFSKASSTKWRKIRYYSKKHKKRVSKWQKSRKKINFKNGIYIVKINSNLNVVNARKVRSVLLNPDKYQNQQYLKNSYFSSGKKYRSL